MFRQSGPGAANIDPMEEEEEGLESPYVIRVMEERDLPRVIEIDRKLYGEERRSYYEEKFAVCIRDPGINTSLVAENDGHPVGFLIGQLLFGEFGIPATRAVLNTIGVHPAFSGQHVAHALLSQFRKNMRGLRVDAIHTLVDWDRFELLGFFKSIGFHPSREVDLVWDIARFPFTGKSTGTVVEAAREADLATVVSIDGEYTQATRSHYFQRKLETAAQRPERNLFLIARVDKELTGFLVANLYQGEFGIQALRGVIDSFGVRDASRHHGVASSLLEQLLAWLREREVRQIETLCRWNEWELLRFFEYVGFRPSARLNLEWRIG